MDKLQTYIIWTSMLEYVTWRTSIVHLLIKLVSQLY